MNDNVVRFPSHVERVPEPRRRSSALEQMVLFIVLLVAVPFFGLGFFIMAAVSPWMVYPAIVVVLFLVLRRFL